MQHVLNTVAVVCAGLVGSGWALFKQWHSTADGSPPLAFYANGHREMQLDLNLATGSSNPRNIVEYGHRVWAAPIVPGRVYRNEATDASHASEFYQIEGFCVDRDVSLADLRSTVQQFIAVFFGESRRIRFRPHFFPFTEPSVEVDMACARCDGAGCAVCGRTGWLEIMGAGMIHPHVFAAAGYAPDAYTGYAFGFGIDRIAMLRWGIDDIRLLYENDLRFLNQFRGAW